MTSPIITPEKSDTYASTPGVCYSNSSTDPPSPPIILAELNKTCDSNTNTLVTVVDIWFVALRALVNMSHTSNTVGADSTNTNVSDGKERTKSRKPNKPQQQQERNCNSLYLYRYGCLVWCVQMLEKCKDWSAMLKQNVSGTTPSSLTNMNRGASPLSKSPIHHASSGCSRALSPQETTADRMVYDCSLFVLTLLTNLSPVIKQHSLRPTHTLYGGSMMDTRAENPDANAYAAKVLVQSLLSLLLCESQEFMSSIVDTESSMHANTESDSTVDSKANNSDNYSTSTDTTSVSMSPCGDDAEHGDNKTNNKNATNTNSNSNSNTTLPIAEIILTGHVALVLYRLTFTSSGDDSTGQIKEGDTSGGSIIDCVNSTFNDIICSQLPQNNWWLPIRILKGFIALQSKVL